MLSMPLLGRPSTCVIHHVANDTPCQQAVTADLRFPSTFLVAPAWTVRAEWIGGKSFHAAEMSSKYLQEHGFSLGSKLEPLPGALASGSLLEKLAVRAFKENFPRPKPVLKSVYCSECKCDRCEAKRANE